MRTFGMTGDEESDDDISSDDRMSNHGGDGCQRDERWDPEQFWDLVATSYKSIAAAERCKW